MTTTDELREAVARAMAETADSPWNISLYPEYWRLEADRIIRLVVERCARWHEEGAEWSENGLEYSALVGIPLSNAEELRIDAKFHRYCADRLRALAPKEPAP